MTAAVVFAYHNVGVRCLKVLLAQDIDVRLVVTHQDNPTENIWFDSVAALAAERGLQVVTPEDPNTEAFIATVRALQPDLIFSFYYRHMLSPALLAVPKLGAFNLHGSLLPKYRGRVPINWAIIRGERETGATLHRMVAKPDAGGIVAQAAVPILPHDVAVDVFKRVTMAAEEVLAHSLPQLVAGTAVEVPQDLTSGSYFGGRKPEDGRIDWTQSAQSIHNLIRGVAPPYPGAFTEIQGRRLRLLRSRLGAHTQIKSANLHAEGNRLVADCVDGRQLELLEVEFDNRSLDASAFKQLFGGDRVDVA
jgi:methionyl-tRNA formyltransferase